MNFLKKRLLEHSGHEIEIVSYADGENASLECLTCGCVIFDSDIYDLCAAEDIVAEGEE